MCRATYMNNILRHIATYCDIRAPIARAYVVCCRYVAVCCSYMLFVFFGAWWNLCIYVLPPNLANPNVTPPPPPPPPFCQVTRWQKGEGQAREGCNKPSPWAPSAAGGAGWCMAGHVHCGPPPYSRWVGPKPGEMTQGTQGGCKGAPIEGPGRGPVPFPAF